MLVKNRYIRAHSGTADKGSAATLSRCVLVGCTPFGTVATRGRPTAERARRGKFIAAAGIGDALERLQGRGIFAAKEQVMVKISSVYQGKLRCSATHGPSTATLTTDAPADNGGRGAAFSPTDLLATSLGTCMLTTMALAAEKLGVDLTGATAAVQKHMVADPLRRVGKLVVEIKGPANISAEHRLKLEKAAVDCPVHQSLHPNLQLGLVFAWA